MSPTSGYSAYDQMYRYVTTAATSSNSTWLDPSAYGILPAQQVAPSAPAKPKSETNIAWLDRRVNEVRNCWKTAA